MSIYNVSKIENWYNDFTSLKKKYENTYLKDYQDSYIKSCKDDITNKMRIALNENYNKIGRLYNNLDNFWKNYLNDLKNTDNYLAGTKSAGSVNDSTVAAKLKNLPELVVYNVDLDIKTSSIIRNTKNWWDNNKDTMAVYGMQLFCDAFGKVEDAWDGATYYIGSAYVKVCTLVGATDEAEYTEEWIKEAIGCDCSTEFLSSFYSSELGREINANSKVKYNSETMSNFSEKSSQVMDYILAVVLPKGFNFVGGALIGGGEEAEKYFQENPDANLDDALTSTVLGSIKKGIKYYSIGDITKGVTKAIKNFGSVIAGGGGSQAVSSIFSSGKNLFTKEAALSNLKNIGSSLKNAITKENLTTAFTNSFKDIDTYLDSLGTASDHIVVDSKTGNVYVDDWSAFLKDASVGFIFNYVFKVGEVGVSSKGTNSLIDEFADDLKKQYNLDNIDEKALVGKTNSKSSIKNKIDDVISGARKNIDEIKINSSARFSSIKSSLSDSFSDFRNSLDNTGSKLTSKLKSLVDDINVKNNMSNLFNDTSSSIKNKIDDAISGVRKNIDEIKINSNTSSIKSDVSDFGNKVGNSSTNKNLEQLRKEYDDLLNKSKEAWFLQAKEARDNGWVWNLNEVNEVDNVVKRMKKLEQSLNIKQSTISKSKIYDYSQTKKEVDALAKKISQQPIPGSNKYKVDTNSEEYKKAMQELYKNPSPSGKQILSQVRTPYDNIKNISESDTGIGFKNYKSNPDLINSSTEDLEIGKKRINELENAFGLNYYNDPHDKKIIDGIEKLVQKNNFSDENIGKIVRNIEAITAANPKFKIHETNGTSAFAGKGFSGKPELLLDSNLLEHSNEVISQTSLHEMGHAYLHIFKGEAEDGYIFKLSDEKKDILIDSMRNLNNNPKKYISYLKKSQEVYNNAIEETVNWYNKIRDVENLRIENIIDELYNDNNIEQLKNVIVDSNGLEQVREILNKSGLSVDEIDDIINNKDIMKKIAITQNNINNQQAHLSELMSSYDNYGDYRKISSTINSMTQKIEHIDPISGDKILCVFNHSDDYWKRISKEDALRSSYDELCADYFSLAAHGRTEVIDMMEEIFGSDLLNSIRGEFSDIVNILESKNLIKR